MPNQADLLAAKQVLSSRFLRAHLTALASARRRTFRVAAAIAVAGRNVHGVGVGCKIVAGERTNEQCVRLYVTQKVAPSLLPPRDRLPESIDGIPTDVVEAAPARISAARNRPAKAATGAVTAATGTCSTNRQKNQRPVIAGISVAHSDVTAGTLACFCRSTRHGDDPSQIFALSNNHVFANVNQSHIGDSLLQPGPADGGISADHFADLHRFVPIHLGGVTPNRVDGAIGALRADVPHFAEVCSIGAITGTRAATRDMLVRKHGRTTGFTAGLVDDLSIDEIVGMDHEDPNIVALFSNQIRIIASEPFPAIGLGGDSGSLIVHHTAQDAVGLYFAGPPNGEYGLANPIANVLSELEIEIV